MLVLGGDGVCYEHIIWGDLSIFVVVWGQVETCWTASLYFGRVLLRTICLFLILLLIADLKNNAYSNPHCLFIEPPPQPYLSAVRAWFRA